MKRIDETNVVSPADKELLADVKGIIASFLPDATVLIYGSTARCERELYSDYDVLVLTSRRLTTAEQDRIRDDIFDLELEREVVMSVLYYSADEWAHPVVVASPYRANIEKEGIVL